MNAEFCSRTLFFLLCFTINHFTTPLINLLTLRRGMKPLVGNQWTKLATIYDVNVDKIPSTSDFNFDTWSTFWWGYFCAVTNIWNAWFLFVIEYFLDCHITSSKPLFHIKKDAAILWMTLQRTPVTEKLSTGCFCHLSPFWIKQIKVNHL